MPNNGRYHHTAKHVSQVRAELAAREVAGLPQTEWKWRDNGEVASYQTVYRHLRDQELRGRVWYSGCSNYRHDGACMGHDVEEEVTSDASITVAA